jgi:SAM-dependent methyltransferase
MTAGARANAEFYLRWTSSDARHTDRCYFSAVDFGRDVLPADLGVRLPAVGPGITLEYAGAPDELIPAASPGARLELPRDELDRLFAARRLPGPFQGRFYPRGWLAGSAAVGDGISRTDMRPFRVAELTGERVRIDLSHPLAGYALAVGGNIHAFLPEGERAVGQCNDIVDGIARQGAGMQCRPAEGSVDFIRPAAFEREDTSADSAFYRAPRFVQHVDATAREIINGLYRRVIAPRARVLDLMSSWVSHLDGVEESVTVSGLGMNAAELAENPRLADRRVQDLNHDPRLPYADGSFDSVICTVSVEYLVAPFDVFAEVARVLSPGGRCIVTFSDRWFPPKAIRLWSELHPFERMGLVLEYFRASGQFVELATESWHGRPRPVDDGYYPQRRTADPVFAVSARRR